MKTGRQRVATPPRPAPEFEKGIVMNLRSIFCFAASALFAAAPAFGGERTIVHDVLGPEGPLVVDGNLYYVGWAPTA